METDGRVLPNYYHNAKSVGHNIFHYKIKFSTMEAAKSDHGYRVNHYKMWLINLWLQVTMRRIKLRGGGCVHIFATCSILPVAQRSWLLNLHLSTWGGCRLALASYLTSPASQPLLFTSQQVASPTSPPARERVTLLLSVPLVTNRCPDLTKGGSRELSGNIPQVWHTWTRTANYACRARPCQWVVRSLNRWPLALESRE